MSEIIVEIIPPAPVEVELAATGMAGAKGDKGDPGPPGLTGDVIHFSLKDDITVGTGLFEVPIHDGTFELEEVLVRVATAPQGASIVIDVKKNGSSIYSNPANRPTIASGSKSSIAGLPTVTFFGEPDYLTIDVVSVGSTTPGANMIVSIRLIKIA